jgi:hypothetical protein
LAKALTGEQLQEAVDLHAKHGTIAEACRHSKWPCKQSAFSLRLNHAREGGFIPAELPVEPDAVDVLKDELRTVRAQLSQMKSEEITRANIRDWVGAVSSGDAEPPKWLTKKSRVTTMGVPTLLASDWHWGEVVNPDEIEGANAFDLEIAQSRARQMVQTSIDLLKGEYARPDYPGIVFALGGDMITGDIHEELSKTNDAPVLPTVLDLVRTLKWCIAKLADEFGNVFVPCVTGNHGRMTKKVQAKERNATNFDWLVYCLLEEHFSSDKRVQFSIPEGSDCAFKIYVHRYLLTHGDQFRGGDGLIGPLGPVTRGRHKKASRNTSINKPFDTMVIGHFHTLMQLPHLIVNGSLKGYDEYAYQGNFTFEVPAQALWITHPERGITHQMPIYLEQETTHKEENWVSWAG